MGSSARPSLRTGSFSPSLVSGWRYYWQWTCVAAWCDPWVAYCFTNAAFYVIWTSLLFFVHLHQMAWGGVTTNERINVDRYVEFSGGLVWPKASSSSQCCSCLCGLPPCPYNRGVAGNLADLCRIRLGRHKPINWCDIYELNAFMEEQDTQKREKRRRDEFIAWLGGQGRGVFPSTLRLYFFFLFILELLCVCECVNYGNIRAFLLCYALAFFSPLSPSLLAWVYASQLFERWKWASMRFCDCTCPGLWLLSLWGKKSCVLYSQMHEVESSATAPIFVAFPS